MNKLLSLGIIIVVSALALRVANSNNLTSCAGDERSPCRVTDCWSLVAGGAVRCGSGTSTKTFAWGGSYTSIRDLSTKCGKIFKAKDIKECYNSPTKTSEECGDYVGDALSCNDPNPPGE